MARTRKSPRSSAPYSRVGGKNVALAKKIAKKRSRGRSAIFRKVKICKNVSVKSREGRAYIRKLHRKSGRKGYVKVPGYSQHYIIDKYHRQHARRGGSRVRRNILAKLRRAYKNRR